MSVRGQVYSLAARERGLHEKHSPHRFERQLCSKRIFALALSQHKELEVVHEHGVHALAIDPAEGRYLLAGGQDRALAIFDTASPSSRPAEGKHKCRAVCRVEGEALDGHKYNVETVQWYPFDTGVFTTSGMDGSLKVWDTNMLQVAQEFDKMPGGKVYDHSMSPIAGHGLIAVGLKHNRIKLCDPSSGSSTHELTGHKSDVLAVAWSPINENLLASAGRDSRVIIWDVRMAGYLHVLDQHNGDQAGASSSIVSSHSGEVNGLAFLPDGHHLVTAGTDHRIRLWDVTTGKNDLKHYPRIDNVYRKKITLGVSKTSRQPVVFCPSRSGIVVVDVLAGTVVNRLQGHYSTVHSCVVHPTMEEMYSGSNDEEILVWSPAEQHSDAGAAAAGGGGGGGGAGSNNPELSQPDDDWSTDDDDS